MQTAITVVHYEIHHIAAYINWIYFFHAWGFSPKYAAVSNIHNCEACRMSWLLGFSETERPKAKEAMQLYKEATRLLNELDGAYKVHATYKLMEAYADGDDLLLDGQRLPLLRQQTLQQDNHPYLCLSDFIRPLKYGIPDTLGAFATTIDSELEQLYTDDDYQRMLIRTLCERLAEAAAEKLHETIRKTVWGYAKDEQLTMKELLNEEYQGIRPATGYPSLPDLSINFILDELIHMKDIGIHLTENGMMQPVASVCGLMFAHPAAHYFSIGKIDKEQLYDYAQRRNLDVETVKKFLRANLKE